MLVRTFEFPLNRLVLIRVLLVRFSLALTRQTLLEFFQALRFFQLKVFFVSIRKRERCTTPEVNAYHFIILLNDRQFVLVYIDRPMDVIPIRLLDQFGISDFRIWIICKLLQSTHSKVSRDSSDTNFSQRLDSMRVAKLFQWDRVE